MPRFAPVSTQRLEALRALSGQAWNVRDYAAHAELENIEVEILEVRHRLFAATRVLKGEPLRFVRELLEST